MSCCYSVTMNCTLYGPILVYRYLAYHIILISVLLYSVESTVQTREVNGSDKISAANQNVSSTGNKASSRLQILDNEPKRLY